MASASRYVLRDDAGGNERERYRREAKWRKTDFRVCTFILAGPTFWAPFATSFMAAQTRALVATSLEPHVGRHLQPNTVAIIYKLGPRENKYALDTRICSNKNRIIY